MSAIETRNLSRESFFLLTELTVDGRDTPERAKVRNLSAGGMMAEGDIEVERGSRVTVELRNIGTVRGTVAWVQDNRFGVAFEKEIDPKKARKPKSGQAPDHAPVSYVPRPQAPEPRAPGRIRKV